MKKLRSTSKTMMNHCRMDKLCSDSQIIKFGFGLGTCKKKKSPLFNCPDLISIFFVRKREIVNLFMDR
jgi:hypothetical protein